MLSFILSLALPPAILHDLTIALMQQLVPSAVFFMEPGNYSLSMPFSSSLSLSFIKLALQPVPLGALFAGPVGSRIPTYACAAFLSAAHIEIA